MGKRTAPLQTYLEPALFVAMESACLEHNEPFSQYVRRLILKDLIDRSKLSVEDVVHLAS